MDTRSYRDGTFVVQLTDTPVATYGGGLPGLKRTAPEPGGQLDVGSGAIEDYLRHLDAHRKKVLSAVPGVKKLYDYDYALNGFAAKLTGEQAAKLVRTPGVASVTRAGVTALHPVPEDTDGQSAPRRPATVPDDRGSMGHLAGNRSQAGGETRAGVRPPDIPGFLGLTGRSGLWSKLGGPEHAGEGTIVGIVDSGFDPSNKMLAPLPEPRPDADVIARKWHGTCDQGNDPAHKVTCNNKVIGAQWFRKGVSDPAPEDVPSPRDTDSHGTHTGTTAAGNRITSAVIAGTPVRGTLTGMAPAARLAYYKACWRMGCPEVDTAAAIDRAVADGVDVLNLSFDGHLESPIYRAATFNAAKAGVFIAGSAGNNPSSGTANHTAPWITSVASTTHDTDYRATLRLGDSQEFTGRALSPGIPASPLINAADAVRAGADSAKAALCAPDTLDPAKAKGKIVVCDRGGDGIFIQDKALEVRSAGGRAVVLVNTPSSAQDSFLAQAAVPLFVLSQEDGKRVKAYATAPAASAALTASSRTSKHAPEVAADSSPGPDPYSGGDMLKPDLSAPGDLVPAGTVPGGGNNAYPGPFGFLSGTSMASPHVAGLAALLKQLHPTWSPMRVKSALMTTATTTDKQGKPLVRVGSKPATPLDHGAGQVRPALAAAPGLVYDSTVTDWTSYLCAVGIAPPADAERDLCGTARKSDPSDLNYPSLAVGDLYGRQTLTRRVTNVSEKSAVYEAALKTPPGFTAKVSPQRLTLRPGGSATYRVTFTRTDAAFDSWSFGALTWNDVSRQHRVTSQIALRAHRFDVPDEAEAQGTSGTVRIATHVGWNGRLTATTTGLYAAEKTTGTLTGTDRTELENNPFTSDAIKKVHLHVPGSAKFTRVAITAADHLADSDIDVYAFDTEGNLAGPLPVPGSDERFDLPPGDYDLYIQQFALPEGATTQQFTLWTWQVGSGDPAIRATVTPPTRPVTGGERPEVTVSWQGAARGERYLGVVEYGDGSATVGRTALTLTP